MKAKAYLNALAMLGISVSSYATDVNALTAEWVRNAESDMKEYRMYLCEGANCTIAKTPAMMAATIPQPAVGVVPSWRMPDGKVGAIAVSAIDLSGNESGLSNVVRFDTATPGTPTGLILKLSIDVLQAR